MDLYECPICKTKNDEKQKNCIQCGHWLLSDAYPARKVKGSLSDKLYVCAFCDTANEPSRNACKKCMRPLFHTGYRTREIRKKRGVPLWLKIIGGIVGGVATLFIALIVAFWPDDTEMQSAAGGVPSQQVKPEVSNDGHSRSKAAAVGATVTSPIEQAGEKFTVSVTLFQTIRGQEALKMIKKANAFNPEPESGEEYMLAKIKFKVISSGNPDVQAQISWMHFNAVSSTGSEYPISSVVMPGPALEAKLYAGASQVGWAAFKVRTDDPAPLIAFARGANGSGGFWFKTK